MKYLNVFFFVVVWVAKIARKKRRKALILLRGLRARGGSLDASNVASFLMLYSYLGHLFTYPLYKNEWHR